MLDHHSQQLDLFEPSYRVRILENKNDIFDAFRLRYAVFVEELGWIPANSARLDVDSYDQCSTLLGAFDEKGKLVGTMRFTPPGETFMLETEFRLLIPGDYPVENFVHAAELTRFAIDPSIRRSSTTFRQITLLLYKAGYHWCLNQGVRRLYFVVAPHFLRALKMLGMPCTPLSAPKKIPPAHIPSVGVILDWDRFEYTHNQKLFHWFNDHEYESNTAIAPIAKRGHGGVSANIPRSGVVATGARHR